MQEAPLSGEPATVTLPAFSYRIHAVTRATSRSRDRRHHRERHRSFPSLDRPLAGGSDAGGIGTRVRAGGQPHGRSGPRRLRAGSAATTATATGDAAPGDADADRPAPSDADRPAAGNADTDHAAA